MSQPLLERAVGGDQDAFRELIDPYRGELQFHCYRVLGSMQDAEDALQETLLSAWRGLGTFESRASVRSWLYRIATNCCLDALRNSAPTPPPPPEPRVAVAAPVGLALFAELARPELEPLAEPEAAAAPVAPPLEVGDQLTRRTPRARVLVAGLSVLAAALLATGSAAGWFDRNPRVAANLGADTTPSATSPLPRATSTTPSPSPTSPAASSTSPAATSTSPTTTATTRAPAAAAAIQRAHTPAATQHPSHGRAAKPHPKSKTPGGSADVASQLAAALTSYYALMPAGTDAAWPQMTADYQQNHAGGRVAYESFWGQIARVTVSNVTPLPPDRAEATLTYYFRDGRVVVERTAFQFVQTGNTLRIASSQVLSSRAA